MKVGVAVVGCVVLLSPEGVLPLVQENIIARLRDNKNILSLFIRPLPATILNT